MRLKRSSEGGLSMSVSQIDMEIPVIEDLPQKQRNATIKEERPPSNTPKKKRSASTKAPSSRYGYSGQLKTVNQTQQGPYMANGKDMIMIQSDVKQSQQEIDAMNHRIQALKRNVEKTEKKKKDINREKQQVIQANVNKMEKSNSRVDLNRRNQMQTEEKKQKIQEERRRRSASKQKAQSDFVKKQDDTRGSANLQKQERLAKLEADKQKDYERRMANYAKIRAEKDEFTQKKREDEIEYLGRIKHTYRKDRDMKKAQVQLNQEMLKQLEEEEKECHKQLNAARTEQDDADYDLVSVRQGTASRMSRRDDLSESQFDTKSVQVKNNTASGSKQKAKQTLVQSSTTTSLNQPIKDNGLNYSLKSAQLKGGNSQLKTIQPVVTSKAQQNGPKEFQMNKPIVKEQATTQPSNVLKEQMVLPKQNNQNSFASPAQIQENSTQVDIKIQNQVSASQKSASSKQTQIAPSMKANLVEDKNKVQKIEASPAPVTSTNAPMQAQSNQKQAPAMAQSNQNKNAIPNSNRSNTSTPARNNSRQQQSYQQTPQGKVEEIKRQNSTTKQVVNSKIQTKEQGVRKTLELDQSMSSSKKAPATMQQPQKPQANAAQQVQKQQSAPVQTVKSNVAQAQPQQPVKQQPQTAAAMTSKPTAQPASSASQKK